MITKRLLLVTVATFGIFLQSGCVTQREVKLAIAESNAAMISPFLDIPKRSPSSPQEGWKEAIKKMDLLIDVNPDHPVLVNQLRLRQAMLLTVNKKDALAQQRWNTIDASSLKTQRDKALFETRNALVWSYKTLPSVGSISSQVSDPYVSEFDDAIGKVKSSDVGIYLSTIRAQIQLKVVSHLNEEDASEAAVATKLLASSLKTFIQAFSDEDRKWVQTSSGADKELEMSITDFRERIWLRDIIRAYVNEAEYRGYEPKWDPEWVVDLQP